MSIVKLQNIENVQCRLMSECREDNPPAKVPVLAIAAGQSVTLTFNQAAPTLDFDCETRETLTSKIPLSQVPARNTVNVTKAQEQSGVSSWSAQGHKVRITYEDRRSWLILDSGNGSPGSVCAI